MPDVLAFRKVVEMVSARISHSVFRHSHAQACGAAENRHIKDFEWFCERTQVSVVVHAKELHGLYEAVARSNNVPVAKLLANSSHETGERLTCCTLDCLPAEWSFMPDPAGYIQPKLKDSLTPIGHSHTGDAPDANYHQRKRAAPPALADGFSPSTPPQRARRAPGAPPKWLEGFSMSPGSPRSELAGATQPVPIRLHKAAFLACCSDPKAANGLEVRHICGNKLCGVVSHFRSGSKSKNEHDKAYKRGRASYCPESFPTVQP